MKNEDLSYILRSIKLSDCQYLWNNIYYIKKEIKQTVSNVNTQDKKIFYSICEFLIIADNGIKKAIIYNCGNIDLHWYTFHKWRGQGVLSNALRTGVIKKMWPQINSVTCHCEWNENREEKYRMTQHLASLADLEVSDERSCWISN